MAPVLTAVLGLVVERVLIRPLYGQDPLYSLLVTFGLAYIFEDMTRYIWGAQSLPFQIPAWLMTPLSRQFFFLTGYRVFMIVMVGLAVGGLFVVLNHTRLGMRIRAGTLDLDTVSVLGVNVRWLRNLNFGIGIYLAGLAGVLAAGLLGSQPTIGASLIMPSFVAIIVGGLGSLAGTLLGGLLIGVASGLAAVYLPSATEAVMYVMMGLVLLIRPRGLLRRGREAALIAARAWAVVRPRAARRRRLAALLVAMPFWMQAIGGYTELAIRVLVLGLAAMALNFLLGFTGVLSFGHAAYFGLGAYGAAMAHQVSLSRHDPGHRVGVLVGTVAAALIGALIVRLRGVYFAMVTIAFGQVFYFIAFRWNCGHRRRRRPHRLASPADRLRLRQARHLRQRQARSTILSLAVFALGVAAMAMLLRSPFGRTLIAIRENERRARFLGIPVERHIWLSFVISCLFVSLAGALYALLNNFTDPRALRWDLSGNFVIMAVLGGMRSFWGPLIGAAIFVVLQDYRVEPDRELDVVHRPVLRAGRAVLSARRARHHPRGGAAA